MLKTSARKPIDIVGLCGQSFAACLAMRPSQSDHEYAQEVVNLSLPYLRRVEDLDATGSGQRLAQKIKWLLTIFNGNWRSKRLVHHCSILCDCGCSDPQEVRFRAVAIYTGFVLGSRPPIPALSKWCKCGLTARWFLFGCGVHHLLQTGFDLLYGISSKRASALKSACAELGQELSALANGVRTVSFLGRKTVAVCAAWALFAKCQTVDHQAVPGRAFIFFI